MSEITIEVLRLSFIWVETVLDLLADVPAQAPLAFLGRDWSYEQAFDRLQETGTGPLGLETPWPWGEPRPHHFWRFYLMSPTAAVTGSRAWRALVPFRGKVPVVVQAPWLPGHLTLEAFFYPHGIALVVTATCVSAMRLDQAVGKAFEVRKIGSFQVRWGAGGPVQYLSLGGLADKALATLRTWAMGPAAAAARWMDPFTVVTVVRGTGVDPALPTPDGEAAHRWLEAMATWRPSWRLDQLPPLNDASLQIRTAPASHVLYGHKRGRAVWFPGAFTKPRGTSRALACYHRNLVLASLQVESLCGLASETANYLRAGMPLAVAHNACAEYAAEVLGLLYEGHRDTYRSWSARAQIEQNNLVTVVNTVRSHFGMDPLC